LLEEGSIKVGDDADSSSGEGVRHESSRDAVLQQNLTQTATAEEIEMMAV